MPFRITAKRNREMCGVTIQPALRLISPKWMNAIIIHCLKKEALYNTTQYRSCSPTVDTFLLMYSRLWACHTYCVFDPKSDCYYSPKAFYFSDVFIEQKEISLNQADCRTPKMRERNARASVQYHTALSIVWHSHVHQCTIILL